MNQVFAGRTLGVATQHEKDKIIGPILQAGLGLKVVMALPIDTDQFGTFSGEVERSMDPLATAKAKAAAGLALGTTDLVLASEGSFGPHPTLGIVPANEEILFLLDAKHNRTFRVKTLQTATNFAQAHCSDWASLKNFAERIRFPSHALILRNSHHLHKGINTWTALENLAADGFPWEACTDMRAHLNPSRQAVIALATKDLLDLLNSFCPACAAPGFGISDVHPGLACAWCQFPTRLTKAYTKTCEACGHNETIDFPQGEKTADPQYCDRCNP